MHISTVSPATGGLAGRAPLLEGGAGSDHDAVVLLQAGQLPTVSNVVAGMDDFAFARPRGKEAGFNIK